MNPETLNLDDAISEIHQIIDQRSRSGDDSPFFFIVGAGISSPPIPLASSIEEDCRIEAAKYLQVQDEKVLTSPLDSYSHWFERAFPSAERRQHYLRKLMERKFISKANFRLAHILLDKKIAKVVITPNFDDFLSRALTLFGERPVVSDHPQTFDRIDPEGPDIQIVHVHGSYWFYDCCNLHGEIEQRAELRTTRSVRSRLGEILHHRSPIVVGYSGWEGDVIMSALQERLSERMGTSIYWFCHRREEVERLPSWLRCSGVKFVIPEEIKSASDTTDDPETLKKPSDALSQQKASTLSASEIFDSFIQKFAIQSPPLTADPLGFFTAQLRESLLSDNSTDAANDVYAISSVVARLERLRSLEHENVRPANEEMVERFYDAVRRSDYSHASECLAEIDPSKLDESILLKLASDARENFYEVTEDKDELACVDFVLRVCDNLESRRALNADEEYERASALLNKAFVLSYTHRREEARDFYKQLGQRYGNRTDVVFEGLTAKANYYLASSFGQDDKSNEAKQLYEQLLARYSDSASSESEAYVCRSLYDLAKMHEEKSKDEEDEPETRSSNLELALDFLNGLVARAQRKKSGGVQATYGRGVLLLTSILTKFDRNDDALEQLDQYLASEGKEKKTSIAQLRRIALARLARIPVLLALGRKEEALETLELVNNIAAKIKPSIEGPIATAAEMISNS